MGKDLRWQELKAQTTAGKAGFFHADKITNDTLRAEGVRELRDAMRLLGVVMGKHRMDVVTQKESALHKNYALIEDKLPQATQLAGGVATVKEPRPATEPTSKTDIANEAASERSFSSK